MPNQKNYSFLLAMAALAVSVGVAGYALLLANSLQGKNRALEAALLAYTSGNFGEIGNETTELEKATAEISGKLAESEAQGALARGFDQGRAAALVGKLGELRFYRRFVDEASSIINDLDDLAASASSGLGQGSPQPAHGPVSDESPNASK